MSDLLLYRLVCRGIEVTSEVICKTHYDHESQDGRSMAPLSAREVKRGMSQTATDYTGERPCAICEEYKERIFRHRNN